MTKDEWSANSEGDEIFVESSDFTHDVRLYIDGDFADNHEKYKYAKAIAKKLNGV